MTAAERAAADAREQLSNLSGLWFSRRAIPLPPAIVVALRDPPANAPAPPRTLRLNDPELRQPWQEYAAQQRTNPEARLED
jgi:outer membrane protein TolC